MFSRVSRHGVSILAYVMLTLAAASAGLAAPKKPVRLQFDLRRLDVLSTLPSNERANRWLSFLQEEIANPSKSLSGNGIDDVVGHHEILAAIIAIGVEAELPQEFVMTKALSLAPGELRTALTLAAGLGGHQAAIMPSAELLATKEAPLALKGLAYKILERVPDPRITPHLARVLQHDSTYRKRVSLDPQTRKVVGVLKEYPVRKWAVSLSRSLERKGVQLPSDLKTARDKAILQEVVPSPYDGCSD